MPTKRTKSQERDRKRRRRLNEDDEAKTRRLEADKIRHKQAREVESVDQFQYRLEADKIRHKQAREVESVDQFQYRLEADKIRHKQAREIRKEVLFLAKTKDVEPFSVGKMNNVCRGCGGLMFSGETHKGKLGKDGEAGTAMFSMCCKYGMVKAPKIKDPPEVLKELLSGDSSNSKKFRANIRGYNNLLSFASKGITGTFYKDGPGRVRGPPLYKMTGQIYHTLANMFQEEGNVAAFSQLYVHDNQEQQRLLQNRNPEVDKEIHT